MNFKSLSFTKIKSNFKPDTLKKIRQVELDYIWLFKGTIKLSFLSLFLFLAHKQIPYFNTFTMEYVNTDKNRKLIDALLPIDYHPCLFMPNCLSQMIYNEIKSSPNVIYKREYIKTHDDALISLDWVDDGIISNEKNIRDDFKKYSKILVILHGLTGGSESSYIREIVDEYKKLNSFKIVVVNYRGINETPLVTPAIYHAGYTEDINTAMKHIKRMYPNLRCYALGTSMGANIFTKLFANTDEFNEYVKGFISISNPFNCYEVEKRNRGTILDFFLIQRQIKYVEKHQSVLKQIVDIEKLALINNYRDFDDLVTLKMFESFENVDDYYIKSSSYKDVENLQIPSLFFNSKDDKLSPIDTLDLENTFRKNKNLILLLTRWGGHVCWFTGIFYPKRVSILITINFLII